MNQARIKGEGWSTANLLKTPLLTGNFIAGCLKAALLFWFFSDFRCGMPLFLLYINIKIGKYRCYFLD